MSDEYPICELYCKLALGSVVAELREELGKQARVFLSNAARKRLGQKMFKMLDIQITGENFYDIVCACKTIKEKGGPEITCYQLDDTYHLQIGQCHLLEATKMEPYVCEITHGWIEAMISGIMKEEYIIEREHTIAEGFDVCSFICKRNTQCVPNAQAAIKRIKDLQTRISNKIVLIMEFDQVSEFNEFSLILAKENNAEIKNVNVHEGKYIAEIVVYREGLARIQ